MIIGIISDSHDHVEHIKKAVQCFHREQVSLVLHAGDYCSPFTIPPFGGLDLVGVFGNNDGDHFRLQMKFKDIDGNLAGEFYAGDYDGRSIALYHGTQPAITEALESCGKYDLVVSGHTHQKKMIRVGKTLALNPGTAHGFGNESTIAVYDTKSGNARIVNIGNG